MGQGPYFFVHPLEGADDSGRVQQRADHLREEHTGQHAGLLLRLDKAALQPASASNQPSQQVGRTLTPRGARLLSEVLVKFPLGYICDELVTCVDVRLVLDPDSSFVIPHDPESGSFSVAYLQTLGERFLE